jgi:signal transduction histidine kinase
VSSGVAGHEVSRHKCLIYDGDPSEQLPVIVPLLMEGLQSNWRCLYLGSPDAVQMVGSALASKGVDLGREATRSSLVLSSDRSHLVGGRFDTDAMIDSLSGAIDGAVEDGFRGLCATGDMRWELGDDENFDQLLRYEARLEQLFREKPLMGICQYHRAMVPAQAVRDALMTHRSTYVGDGLNRDNLFYVPPELLLDPQAGPKLGEWMCQQIVRVLDADRARDEVLRDLERRVAERTAELAATNRHLRAFSYSVSHDLRAPLRAIEGFARAVVEDCGQELGASGREQLERVLANTKRMGELIEGMLVLGRTVEVEMRRVPVDLSALAGEAAQEIRGAHPGRVVDMTIQPGLLAEGDPVLLRAVFANLLGNAWKFTSRSPRARIEVGRREQADGTAAFFVRDDGAGFDMKYAQRLFGLFQRMHPQSEFPGTGVGLATVERIVSRHGGRIWAESRPGEGATFFFTLSPSAATPRASDA